MSSAYELYGYRSPSGLDLVKLLLSADEAISFPKFMELPPELRLLVAQFYLDDLHKDGPLLAPVQPPLTRTSRYLRKEVLPLFSKTVTFAIEIARPLSIDRFATSPWRTYESALWMACPANSLFLCPNSIAWLHSLTPEPMAGIKEFVVRYQGWCDMRISVKDYPVLRQAIANYDKGRLNNSGEGEISAVFQRHGKWLLLVWAL
jgi:hypothetical protein